MATKNTTYELTIRVTIQHNEDVDPNEVIDEMDFSFTSNTENATITNETLKDKEEL